MQSLICLCNIVKFEELFRSIITCIAIRCIRWNDKEREKKGERFYSQTIVSLELYPFVQRDAWPAFNLPPIVSFYSKNILSLQQYLTLTSMCLQNRLPILIQLARIDKRDLIKTRISTCKYFDRIETYYSRLAIIINIIELRKNSWTHSRYASLYIAYIYIYIIPLNVYNIYLKIVWYDVGFILKIIPFFLFTKLRSNNFRWDSTIHASVI